MDLIVTHINADFDALASVLAARKLYPEAKIFFPGSREESVRRMLETGLIDLEELRQRRIVPEEIRRVILCDIRQANRVGAVRGWLEAHPEIEVLAFDHHPDTPEDLAYGDGLVDPTVGSTSTLMVELLREKGIELSPEEVTVLLMGIYEDTGSLTHATTSPRDLAAAGWLLAGGADLALVRRFAIGRLDAERLSILHRMIRELEIYHLRGHRVGVVALELGAYVGELAQLVSRALEIFELPTLIALFGEADRVTVIARGDEEGVDLGAQLRHFAGGGGHATAAAGRLKGVTVIEARERLISHLEASLPPAARAEELMIENFVGVPVGATIEEAKDRLVTRKINAAPVLDEEGRALGGVSRQTLDAALQHGMGDRPVTQALDRELVWVGADAAAEEAAGAILDHRSRFVLIGDPESGRPRGLITRTEILRHLHHRSERLEETRRRVWGEPRRRSEKIGRLLERNLAPGLRPAVAAMTELAARRGEPVYLVGGLVRDLLLERPNRDLDVVVEGNGLAFAEELAASLGGRCHGHPAFLTAVVVDPAGLHIDVATARSEFYRAPAALPEVETSSLRPDLYRRDFSVNTLAIRLGPKEEAVLIDHFAGRRDLREKTLRVLHSLSFVDDPTRAFRAVRLESRLEFRMSKETLHLLRVALEEGAFDRLSGSRLREELHRLLDDPAIALPGLNRLDELGLLACLHPELVLDRRARSRLFEALAAFEWHRLEGIADPPVALWLLLLRALSREVSDRGRLKLAARLQLAGENLELLTAPWDRLEEARGTLETPDLRPHRVSEALTGLSGEDLLQLMSEGGEEVRVWIRRELTELRPLRLEVRGADLLAAGHPSGPEIGHALSATRRARLDGKIGPDQEMGFALEVLSRGAAALLLLVISLLTFAGVAGFAGLSAVPASAQTQTQTHRPVFGEPVDPFGRETPREPLPGAVRQVLRYECKSGLGVRGMALFDDGVVRLRRGLGEETPRLRKPRGERKTATDLVQLDPTELDAILARLEEEELPARGDLKTTGPGGEWVESCVLRVDLSAEHQMEIEFRRYDVVSLPVTRLIAFAEDVIARAKIKLESIGLSESYDPRVGDILERSDGQRFEIVWFTQDGGGVELRGKDQPVSLFIPKSEVRYRFVAIVSRRSR